MEKRQILKALSSKAKVQYIWDYYKLHILFGGVIAAIVIGLGYHFITYRKPVLSVIMINVQTTSENAEAAFDEFSDATGYDKKQQPIDVSANLQFSDDPNATTDYNDYMGVPLRGAGGPAVVSGTGCTDYDDEEESALMDLRTYVSDDVLEKYKDHLIYSTDDGESESYPCAIELTDNQWIQKYGIYDSCYLVFSAAPSRKITIRNLRISC